MARRLLGSLLGFFLVVGAQGADRPPPQLHLVGDHWTAWNPPTPPAGAQVHVVLSGDTLWDLAQRYLGDPYLWPQLWEKNQYILDAHWIYPGDPVLVGIEVAPVEEVVGEAMPSMAPGEPVPAEPMPAAEDAFAPALAAARAAPQPLGAEDDIYCSGYIGELEESFSYRITGSEYQTLSPSMPGAGRSFEGVYGTVGTVKYGLSLGDIIYVDGGSDAGLSPGALYTVVLPGAKVLHPVTRALVGRLYEYQGRVRVLSVQPEAAIAEIVQACDPIRVGAALAPFTPEPVPLGRLTAPRPVNEPAPASSLAGAPIILMARDGLVSMGQDHVVYIDRGEEQDLTPGDLFTIYRMNREGFPPLPIGELAVLSVQRHSALAKILESRATIYAGDRLEPK